MIRADFVDKHMPQAANQSLKVNGVDAASTDYTSLDIAKIKKAVAEIEKGKIDITDKYEDEWIEGVGFPLAKMGEQGRDYFHRVSQFNPGYDQGKCDEKFDNLVANKRGGGKGLGSFFELCKRYDIDFRPDKLEPVFWGFIERKKGDKVQSQLMISWSGLIDFMEYHGFRTLIHLDIKIPARIQNNIVLKVDCDDIKHFVLNWVEHADHLDNATTSSLREKLLAGSSVYFGKGNISSLRPVKFNPLRSADKTSYFPYRNGIVKVTKDKIELTPYKDCKFHVWKSQIIDRDFTLNDQFKKDFNFYRFLQNITGNDQDRLNSLLSYLGFMLHPYRDPAKPQVLIFYDQQISDNPEGGTGKGIVAQAIGQIKTTVTVDGKNFKADNQFCWQRVGMDTQLVVFQDTTKWFKFDRLHSVITDGMVVNPKHSSEFFIPYQDSPKFIINTNYILDAEGASNKRRMKEVEFEPYYHAKRTPEDEFGELFFHSWNDDTWFKFDNLMMDCLQSFLKDGFIDPSVSSKTKGKRLFLQKFGEDTLEFIENLPDGEELRKLETFKKYKDAVGETMKYITSNAFYKALESVPGASDIITDVKYGRDTKSTWFKLVKENECSNHVANVGSCSNNVGDSEELPF